MDLEDGSRHRQLRLPCNVEADARDEVEGLPHLRLVRGDQLLALLQVAHDLHEGARAHTHARGASVAAAREPERQQHVGRVAVGPALQAHRLEAQRVHRVRPIVVGGAHPEDARDSLRRRAVEQAKDGTLDVAADLGVLALEAGDAHRVPKLTRLTHARGAQQLVPLAAPVQAAVCGVRPEMTAVVAALRPGSAVPRPGRPSQAACGQLEARRDGPAW